MRREREREGENDRDYRDEGAASRRGRRETGETRRHRVTGSTATLLAKCIYKGFSGLSSLLLPLSYPAPASSSERRVRPSLPLESTWREQNPRSRFEGGRGEIEIKSCAVAVTTKCEG